MPDKRHRGPRQKSYERALVWSGMRKAGMTERQIAEMYEVSPVTISQALRRYGLHEPATERARKQQATLIARRAAGTWSREHDERRDLEIVRLLREEKLTGAEVARRFGISRERVRQVALKNGVNLGEERNARFAEEKARRTDIELKQCVDCPAVLPVGEYRTHWFAEHRMKPEWKARDAAIATDYAAGMKIDDIRAKHRTTANAVMRALDRTGTPRRRPNGGFLGSRAEIQARKERIRVRLDAGQNHEQIAQIEGCSRAWVGLIAKEFGLQRGKDWRRAQKGPASSENNASRTQTMAAQSSR